MPNMATIQTLLRSAIKNRLDCEYTAVGASPSKRRYQEGRIAAIVQCLTDDPSVVLGKAVERYTTEHHQAGDDISYPEGTSVHWMRGCIQAAQDVIRGEGEQAYGSPITLTK